MSILQSLALCFIALIAFARAQSPLYFTSTITAVTAGLPVNITYYSDNMTQPVAITLLKGNPNNLGTVGVLTNDTTNGTFVWIPRSDLVNAADYAFEITQGDQINYSAQFSVGGGMMSAATSISSTASASSAMSTSSLNNNNNNNNKTGMTMSIMTAASSMTATNMISVQAFTRPVTGVSYNVTPSQSSSAVYVAKSSAYNMTGLSDGPLLTASGTPTPWRSTPATTLTILPSCTHSPATNGTAALVKPTSSVIPFTDTASDLSRIVDSSLALAFGLVVAVAFLG